jgi:type I restriction enzyme S subunit
MSEHDFANLPNSWAIATVAQSGTVITGNTPPTSEQENYGGTLPFIKPPHLQESGIHTSDQFLTERGASRSRVLPPCSVLVSCIGNLGKTGINRCPVAFNQQINAIVPSEAFMPLFLFYQAQSPRFRQQIESRASATTISIVNKGNFETIRLAIAPLAEQRRIVGKVEELFSELDEGVANLKQARAQLAVYRQALLKHAFEGHLTADWRSKHASKLESADQLLARIRAEREERYQRQLKEWEELHTKWERTGGKTTKPSKPGKPVPQSPISAEILKTLPNLPEGWAHLRLGELIDEPAYGTSKKCDYETKGTGVLRIPNVVAGSIDATDLKYASFTPEEVQGYALEVGDLLMIRSNGSVSIVGRCALIRDIHTHLLYAGYLIRLRPHASAVDPAFLHRQLLSHALRHQIEQAAKSTSGVNNINSGEIQSLVIAVCSVAEQQEIITQLEEKLSAISALEADIDLNLQKAEALRQSILKKAFAGELVPQDPADEPAAALLARIRAEREGAATQTPKKKAARSKGTA